MKRIRILFTIPNFDTAGSGKALVNIAKGLNPDKFEVHILCLHSKGAFFKVVEASGIPVHTFSFIPDARPIFKMFIECWRISRYLKKEINPDIIHSYNYSANYTEALAAKLAGIPWVFTKKNMNWGGKSKNAWKLRSLLANKIAIQNKDMKSLFYNQSKKTVLIPRGVDVIHFQSLPPIAERTNLITFSSDQRIVICVANFVPVKGVEILIRAFYKLYETHSNWSLLLVGDANNEYGQKLQTLVDKLKMKERIKFAGKLLDVRQSLNRAEIFVLPTRNEGEGSPVAILEAMAAGKLVIGSNVPGIRDQLENFPDNLFEPSNIEELSSKLEYFMLKSKEDIRKLGFLFLTHVVEKYPIAKETKMHELLYESIIDRT